MARKRRLVAGLIPVGKREAYMGAGMQTAAWRSAAGRRAAAVSDPRMILFWSQVTEPWKKLLEQAANGSKMNKGSRIPDDPNADPPRARESQRRQHRSDDQTPARTDSNRLVVRPT